MNEVAVITHADVRASVDRAKNHVSGFWAEIKWQVDHEAWLVLGYETFDAMWEAEYEKLDVSIKRDKRPELVAALRSVGQTQQQIAEKLRVGTQTVNRDLNSQMRNDDDTGPLKITNARGQERPTTYRRKDDVIDAEVIEDAPHRREPNRQQFPPQLRNALTDLERVTNRIRRITEDDRFNRHKDDHAALIRRIMGDMINICQQTIERLPEGNQS